jgi:hypothetical protein
MPHERHPIISIKQTEAFRQVAVTAKLASGMPRLRVAPDLGGGQLFDAEQVGVAVFVH